MLVGRAISNPKFGNFKVGDRVRCLQEVHFTYGNIHLQGNIYTIQADTLSYYNVMHKNYKLVIKEINHANTNSSK
jgi:hypothetical protein